MRLRPAHPHGAARERPGASTRRRPTGSTACATSSPSRASCSTCSSARSAPATCSSSGPPTGSRRCGSTDALAANGGRLVSVELDADRSRAAGENLERAGLDSVVELRHGAAADALRDSPAAAWDVVFLDAERPAYPGYWPDLARVIRPGGLIAADNAISHADQMQPFREAVEARPARDRRARSDRRRDPVRAVRRRQRVVPRTRDSEARANDRAAARGPGRAGGCGRALPQPADRDHSRQRRPRRDVRRPARDARAGRDVLRVRTTDPLNDRDRDAAGALRVHRIPTLHSTDLVHWTYTGYSSIDGRRWVRGGTWTRISAQRGSRCSPWAAPAATWRSSTTSACPGRDDGGGLLRRARRRGLRPGLGRHVRPGRGHARRGHARGAGRRRRGAGVRDRHRPDRAAARRARRARRRHRQLGGDGSRACAEAGANRLEAMVGDMASTRAEGDFALVYLVFNTIFNLTSQDGQVACRANAAAHLVPRGPVRDRGARARSCSGCRWARPSCRGGPIPRG